MESVKKMMEHWSDMAKVSLSPERYPYIYRWGNNPVRIKLKGQKCIVLQPFRLGSVLLLMENGKFVVSSRRALRKIK